MIKIQAILLLGILVAFAGQSQKAKVVFGTESEDKTITGFYYAKKPDNSLIVLTLETRKTGEYTRNPVIALYNKQLRKGKEFELPKFDKDAYFDQMISNGTELLIFTHNTGKQNQGLYCQKFNIETFAPLGGPVLLAPVDQSRIQLGDHFYGNNGVLDSHKDYGNPKNASGFLFSNDSSKFVVLSMPDKKSKESEKVTITVFTNRLEKLWERSVDLNEGNNKALIYSACISNDGKVYIASKKYGASDKESVKSGSGNGPGYEAKLLCVEKDQPRPQEFTIGSKDKFVNTVSLFNEPNGAVLAFGLYQQTPEENITGYFISTLAPAAKTAAATKDFEFPETLLAQILADKQSVKKWAPGIGWQFSLARMLQLKNGSKNFVLEYYQATAGTYAGVGSNMNTNSNAVFGNIINIQVDAGNNNPVYSRIPRFTGSAEMNGYVGVLATTYQDKLVLIFNDIEDNIALGTNESPMGIMKAAFKRPWLQMAVIEPNGSFKRTIVSKTAGNKEIWAAHSILLDHNTIISNVHNLLLTPGVHKVTMGVLYME